MLLLAVLCMPFISFAQTPASCTQGGKTIASGASSTYYLMSTVLSGDTCASIAQTRTCSNGVLSGDKDYSKGSCTVLPATAVSERQLLANFLPYVYSTTWYPWFNDTIGLDPDVKGLALLKTELPKMKAAGINTVWIGGNAIWKDLQPTAGVWNEAAFNRLVLYLQELQKHNMRAIYQLNYVGPGFAPAGIDGCKWMQRSDEIAKFNTFAERLVARLEPYNYMIYYMVYTEYPPACSISTINNVPFFSNGIYYYSANNPQNQYEYLSSYVNSNIEPWKTYHNIDVHTLNQWLKQSVGRVSAPASMNQTIRHRMFLGIHDVFVPHGEILDDAPIESISYFDYFSIPYYLKPEVRDTIPIDLAFTLNTVTPAQRAAARAAIFSALDTNVANIRRFYPSIPLMLGEYGFDTYDPGTGYVLKQHSPSKNFVINTMIDWGLSKNPHIGFNVWAWTGRYLDLSAAQYNALSQDKKSQDAFGLILHDTTPTTVVAWLKCRLLGGACPTN